MHAPAPLLTGKMHVVCPLCEHKAPDIACSADQDGQTTHRFCDTCAPYIAPEAWVHITVVRDDAAGNEQSLDLKVPILSVEPAEDEHPAAVRFGSEPAGFSVQPAPVGYVMHTVASFPKGLHIGLTPEEIRDAQEAYLDEDWA